MEQNKTIKRSKIEKDVFYALRELFYRAVDCELDGLENEDIKKQYDKIVFAMDSIRETAEAILNVPITIDKRGLNIGNKEFDSPDDRFLGWESGRIYIPFIGRENNGQ